MTPTGKCLEDHIFLLRCNFVAYLIHTEDFTLERAFTVTQSPAVSTGRGFPCETFKFVDFHVSYDKQKEGLAYFQESLLQVNVSSFLC